MRILCSHRPARAGLTEQVSPAPAEWRRNFVPAPLTALIGRDTEVSRVRDLMARSRLVTLTGPGGAGKTRLAIDIAGREAANGQVWYVDLSSIDLPELVASTVAGALGALMAVSLKHAAGFTDPIWTKMSSSSP